jgi:hypothetical protein
VRSRARAEDRTVIEAVVAVTALVLLVLAAAAVYDWLDARAGAQAALRAALERGEIGAEDYARYLQAPERAA